MPQRVQLLSLAILTAVAACSSDPAGGGSTTASSSVVVFHTASAVLSVREDDIENTPFRTKIDNFFPAACVDRDDDDDGIPNSLDHHRSRGADDHGDDDDHDGGIDDHGGTRDAGVRDDDDDLSPLEQNRRCSRCNRGPGESGDFRLEVRGSEGKLDRGTVMAAADGTVTVASPDGAIRIVVTAGTDVRDGAAAPGAEIRAEGTVTRDAAGLILTASRLEVLCAAPAAMPAAEVPAAAQPVPFID